MNVNIWQVLCVSFLMIMCGTSVYANDTYQMKVNISGNVVASGSCTFNSYEYPWNFFGGTNQWIRFRKKNGSFELIDSKETNQLDIGMTCNGDVEGDAEMLITPLAAYSIVGINYNGHEILSVTMDDTSTISENLGVEVLVNGNIQDVGTTFKVDLNNPPILKARLVQIGTADDIKDGTGFRSGMMVQMSLQ